MYYYEIWCEGGFLHDSKDDFEFTDYDECEEEAKADCEFETSLEPTRRREDYWYEIKEY